MYGGPIAIALPTNNKKTQWKISIFTANGRFISLIEASSILKILWSRDQKVFFSVFCNFFKNYFS